MMETTYNDRAHDARKDATSCGESDRLTSYVWAGLFLWAGTSLILEVAGVYASVGLDGWVAFFFGVAAILLSEIAIRWVNPTINRPELITYVGTGVAIGIATGAFWLVFAVIMVAVGISILVDTARTTDGRSSSGPIA